MVLQIATSVFQTREIELVRVRWLIVVGLVALSKTTIAVDLRGVLDAQRPPSMEVLDLVASQLPAPDLNSSEYQNRFRLCDQAVQTLIPLLTKFRLVLVGRAMDSLYEAFMAVFAANPEYRFLESRLILLPMSRLVLDSSDLALREWLAGYSLSVESITAEDGLIIIDQGWRGRIPSRIREVLAGAGNVEVRLFHSQGNYRQLFEVDLDAVVRAFNGKNRPGWNHRISAVYGRNNVAYESEDRQHVVDRRGYLQWMLAARLYYSQDEVRRRFGNLLRDAFQGAPSPLPSPVLLNDIKLLEQIFHGSKTDIYLASTPSRPGWRFAIKKAIGSGEESAATIHTDAERLTELEQLGVPHPRLLRRDHTLLAREFVDGHDGKRVLDMWSSQGISMEESGFHSLLSIMRHTADQGTYVRNLRPSNLIFRAEDGQWVVVDTSGTSVGHSRTEVLGRYKRNLNERWLSRLSGSCAERFSQWVISSIEEIQ